MPANMPPGMPGNMTANAAPKMMGGRRNMHMRSGGTNLQVSIGLKMRRRGGRNGGRNGCNGGSKTRKSRSGSRRSTRRQRGGQYNGEDEDENNMEGGGKTLTVGSKAQVWHGNAKHTSGGLTKKDLMKHKGRIVSKKKHALGKKAIRRLAKAGYKAKKGTFKLFRK